MVRVKSLILRLSNRNCFLKKVRNYWKIRKLLESIGVVGKKLGSVGKTWKSLEKAGNCWKVLEKSTFPGKLFEKIEKKTGNHLKSWKLLEKLEIIGKSWKLFEKIGKSWKLLEIVGKCSRKVLPGVKVNCWKKLEILEIGIAKLDEFCVPPVICTFYFE